MIGRPGRGRGGRGHPKRNRPARICWEEGASGSKGEEGLKDDVTCDPMHKKGGLKNK